MRAAASFLASHLTLQIICRSCGGAGHMARDCLKSRDPNSAENPQQQQFDNEYANLMAELGEGPKDNSGVPPPAANVPPWRDPANWSLAFYSDCSPRRWLTCKVTGTLHLSHRTALSVVATRTTLLLHQLRTTSKAMVVVVVVVAMVEAVVEAISMEADNVAMATEASSAATNTSNRLVKLFAAYEPNFKEIRSVVGHRLRFILTMLLLPLHSFDIQTFALGMLCLILVDVFVGASEISVFEGLPILLHK